MGYPMTWKRIINRNGLADGGYGEAPERWAVRTNVTDREPIPAAAFTGVPENERAATSLRTTQDLSNHRADRLIAYENAAKMLAGDLRRLEQDIVDEGAICKEIARKAALDTDTVAAVLKEFVAI